MFDGFQLFNGGLCSAVIAGMFTMLATGLGALPVLLKHRLPEWVVAAGAALAGGMMVSVTAFDLLVTGVERGTPAEVGAGFLLGCLFLWGSGRVLTRHIDGIHIAGLQRESGRRAWLILLVMFVHSFPEGLAVGVSYASESRTLGVLVALAIAVHNIPEGMVISLPLAAEGVGFRKCFLYSVLSSFPQPLGVIPAYLLGAFFKPLLPASMGFAGGAMIYLVLTELLPKSLKSAGKVRTAWAFVIGFVAFMQLEWL
ncbi:MAG: ZIP family metal transporter [Kiritimatiellae bacterium]|jgi:zinc transporter ZupT|nr:ZIP family metal transporter [Kiritimatiellia bacterium]MDY0149471.1 ZIP family metal transporter [Kiritimatiellia bacterium]